MNRVRVGGVSFHVWQGGDGDDVLMVHGLTSDLSIWHFTLAAALLPRHRVTMFDLRGHGFSDMPETGYDMETMVTDCLGVMAALKIERAHIMGHSYGADIALQVARRQPHRVGHIVAIEAALAAFMTAYREPGWEGWNEWADVLSGELNFDLDGAAWAAWFKEPGCVAELGERVAPDRIRSRRGQRIYRLLTETTFLGDYQALAGEPASTYGEVASPTLLVYGEESPYRPSAELLGKWLPHSRRIDVPQAGHFSIFDHIRKLDALFGFRVPL